MDYADYVRNVSFRYLKPTVRRPSGLRRLAMILSSCGIHLEALNTRLPEEQAEMRRRLNAVCRIPRMSTFAIGALINRAVSQMPAGNVFLNIGVWNGFTFFSGLAGNDDKKCIAVDNFSHKNSPRGAFYDRFRRYAGRGHFFREMDFREYLREAHTEPIGVYLFDGPHTYRDQYDGLALAEPFFAENCIVLVDDTNWEQVRRANLDFLKNSPHDYRVLLDVRTPQSGHPTFWNGLMIFQMTRRRAGAAAA